MKTQPIKHENHQRLPQQQSSCPYRMAEAAWEWAYGDYPDYAEDEDEEGEEVEEEGDC